MIVVVGGAGAVGAAAVGPLVAAGHEVVVADRDAERAARVARRHGARALALDLTDDRALRAALTDARLVVGAAGPFYRFGPAVLQAALDTATHYVDVADDPVPTLAMLDLHERAVGTGVAAVVGAGASPGLSNLLTVLAAERLDTAESVVTAWPEDPVADLTDLGPAPSAATVHWVHQFAHPVPVLREGRLVEVQPLIEVPMDLGGLRLTGHLVGHPEAVTLHLALTGLRDSTNAMLLRPGDARILHEVAAAVHEGLSDADGAALLRRRFADVAAGPSEARGRPPAVEQLLAWVRGTAGGRPATAWAALTAYPPGGMATITALPAVAAVEQVLHDPRPGVRPPELALDARAAFDALAAHVPGVTSGDDLVEIRGPVPLS